MRLACAFVIVLAAACGGGKPGPKAPEPAAGPDLSPALAPVRWMVGDWEGESGREHWVATAGVFYGVAFHPDGTWEAMIIDDATEDAEGAPDGTLRLYAMPDGAAETIFTVTRSGTDGLRFENPAHDDPKVIEYTPADDGLSATVSGPGGERIATMTSIGGEPSEAAEQADNAFARDTDAERARGWVSYFSADGAMMRKGARVEGSAAIEAAIAPLLGRADLLWQPIWSRESPDGRLAATVGRARIVKDAKVTWRGSYLTIWHAEADGWKVLLDVGRGEQPLK